MGKDRNTGLKSTVSRVLRHSGGFSLLEVMVALAILGVAIVAIFQLFSTTLRSTDKADKYSRALFYARSLLDEGYGLPDPEDTDTEIEFEEDFEGSRSASVISMSEDGRTKLYELTVKVTWPPHGSITLKGLRSQYAKSD